MLTILRSIPLFALCLNAAAFDPNNPCGLPINPPPPSYYTDLFLTQQGNACAPWPLQGFLNADSTTPILTRTTGGLVAYWYCKDFAAVPPVWTGRWHAEAAVASNAKLTDPAFLPALQSDLQAAQAAADPLAAFNALVRARLDTPMNDPDLAAAWCPAWPSIYRGAPPEGQSLDGTLVPPYGHITDATLAVWTILPTGFSAINGTATNGHATQLLLRGGAIYAKSPTGGFWWKWLGANTWQRLTTVQP